MAPTSSHFTMYRGLFKAKPEPTIVDVPEVQAIMLDGRGRPEDSPSFQAAIQALYGLTYTTKFSLKGDPRGEEYRIMPLEGLWWVDKPEVLWDVDASLWLWTLFIVQPDFLEPAMLDQSRQILDGRGRRTEEVDAVRLAKWNEGLSGQVMHIGPYSEEQRTIERLHAFIRERGFAPRGRHHEIYLGDPRRADPKKLKTVIRQPMGKAT